MLIMAGHLAKEAGSMACDRTGASDVKPINDLGDLLAELREHPGCFLEGDIVLRGFSMVPGIGLRVSVHVEPCVLPATLDAEEARAAS